MNPCRLTGPLTNLIEGEAMTKYLYSPEDELGISVVLLYGDIGRLPNDCKVVIRRDSGFSGYFQFPCNI